MKHEVDVLKEEIIGFAMRNHDLHLENDRLVKKVEHLNELLACYRARIEDLEDMLSGEDYEE